MKRSFVGVIAIIWLLMGWIPSRAQNPSVRINEILASNASINTDRYGKYSDWIELVNLGNAPISLEGFFITDDPAEPTKWTFPSVNIPAKGYLLVWASKKDKYIDGELHANFKLSSGGEFVGLYDPAGSVIDTMTFGEQQTDVSYGRLPDGIGSFQFISSPTPGAKNSDTQLPVDTLIFSKPSGFYDDTVMLELSTNIPGGQIRYTTNGSMVNINSNLYQVPIEIHKTQVVRARVFRDGGVVSKEKSHFYMIHYPGHLPVLSLATDEGNLYGNRGILTHYDERGRDWEVPVAVNYIPIEEKDGFQIYAGLRVHGQHSRSYPKKSMRLYFRSDYGQSKLHYHLFDQKNLDSFKCLVIHSGGSEDQYYGGSWWTLLRDPLNHKLWLEKHGNISAFRAILLYINGEFWGIYHLRERINDYYLKSNYDIENSDLLKWHHHAEPEVEEGDTENWDAVYDFFKNHDFTNEGNYQQATELINIDNFIDYNIIEIYGGHKDWPHNNVYFFRDREHNGKWNWILWDSESTYQNYRIKGLEWASRNEVRTDISPHDGEGQLFATLLLSKLIENRTFRDRFANRFADWLNTSLREEHVEAIFDSMVSVIAPDIPLEVERWQTNSSNWETGISRVKTFIQNRDPYIFNHIQNSFHYSGTFHITLGVEGQGSIRINSILPRIYPWVGKYFKGVPIQLEAIPSAGYEFAGWGSSDFPHANVVEQAFYSDVTVTARFVRKTSLHSVLINEIMASNDTTIADDDGDYSDWLELVNTNSWDVNLKGYFLTDDKDEPNKWIFPDTMIRGNGYLLIWASKKDRKGSGELHTNFKISAKKEYIGFYSPGGEVMDSITVRNQETDISFARIPDGGAEYRKTATPTPGTSNVFTEPFLTGRGKISYYSNNTLIPNILMEIGLQSGGVERIEVSGDFQYDRLKAGESYYLVPSKISDSEDQHAVTMYDAALVARYSVGLSEFTPLQQVVGDADQDKAISMYDAAKIARFSVGLVE